MLLLVAASASWACGGEPVVPSGPRVQPATVDVRPLWEVREERVERVFTDGKRPSVLAFRATDGLVALLADSPLATWQFMVVRPQYPAHGRIRRTSRYIGPSIGLPSDIVGVTNDGVTWYLDSARSRIVSRDVGSVTSIVAQLGPNVVARRGCMLSEDRLLYVDASRPSIVFDHAQTTSTDADTMPVDGEEEQPLARWKEMRFGGSLSGGCLLWAPGFPRAWRFVIDSSRTGGMRIDTLHWRKRTQSGDHWWRFAWRSADRQRTSHPRDATTLVAGLATLTADSEDRDTDVVELRDQQGEVKESWRLPRRALAIAGSRHRLFVLSAEADSIMLAAYHLPEWTRPGALEAGTDAVAVPRLHNVELRSDDALRRHSPKTR